MKVKLTRWVVWIHTGFLSREDKVEYTKGESPGPEFQKDKTITVTSKSPYYLRTIAGFPDAQD